MQPNVFPAAVQKAWASPDAKLESACRAVCRALLSGYFAQGNRRYARPPPLYEEAETDQHWQIANAWINGKQPKFDKRDPYWMAKSWAWHTYNPLKDPEISRIHGRLAMVYICRMAYHVRREGFRRDRLIQQANRETPAETLKRMIEDQRDRMEEAERNRKK